ncbi:MAG TPA: hypothetical protein VKJ47_14130 [Candidatus Binatia bacterium]|nr:hypothetical protein [Candidatus Binatia bacterium]
MESVRKTESALALPSPEDPGDGPAESVPIPAPLHTEAFKAAWRDWLATRSKKRKPIDVRTAAAQLGELIKIGPVRAVECIRASVANGSRRLFAERFTDEYADRHLHPAERQARLMQRQIAEALGGGGGYRPNWHRHDAPQRTIGTADGKSPTEGC